MRDNGECGRTESAGERRVRENGECGRTESAGERRVRDNGECGRTESAGERRVRENGERTDSVGEHSTEELLENLQEGIVLV